MKIIYSKYAKAIYAICAIVLIVTMLWQSYYMLERYNEYRELYKEYEDIDTLWVDDYYEVLESDLQNIVLEVLAAEKEGGIDKVIQYYEAYEDKRQTGALKVFNILIADEQRVYSSMDEKFFETDTPLGFAEGYRMNITYNSSVEHMYFLNSNEAKVYKYMYDGYEEFKNDPNDWSDTIHNWLEDNDGHIVMQICLTSAYCYEVEWDYYNQYEMRLEHLRNDYSTEMKERFIIIGVEAVCLLLVLLVAGIAAGRNKDGLVAMRRWDSKATEFHVLMLLLSSAPVIGLHMYVYTMVGRYGLGNGHLPEWFMSNGVKWTYLNLTPLLICAFIYEQGVLVKKYKNKRILKDSIIVRFVTVMVRKILSFVKRTYDISAYAAMPRIKKVYVRKFITDIIVAVTTVCIVAQITHLTMYYNFDRAILLYVSAIVGVVVYFINSFIEYRNLRKYNQVVEAIETIYCGDYKNLKKNDDEKNEALNMLYNLSTSFEESVRKQVEAEKLQIELVANVSHDLKTPLTSIISYVELLKEEEMSDAAKDYVKVLSDKSARLKDIVADVFDLAKATSGEEVHMEQLDGVVLINQVLSDMQDVIDASGKDMRTSIVPATAPINSNGQKLYRVFQNIIDNALKYSMSGTRIYLTAEIVDGEFVVTLKNVSAYEMDFTSEEIMSRFTRGDKARHSDGNGLGLSIAKSFTEQMGGTFTVEIDDDVFKTVVKLR